ncbi:hypothetical protein BDZ89DRAFT_256998 [Hymenopellis radicata]|nr:hypothetical protein BDZ89DRAFT_256998 [Hymenopellis radicata]
MRVKGGRMDLKWTLRRLQAGGVAGPQAKCLLCYHLRYSSSTTIFKWRRQQYLSLQRGGRYRHDNDLHKHEHYR